MWKVRTELILTFSRKIHFSFSKKKHRLFYRLGSNMLEVQNIYLNPLSADPTKWSNILKQLGLVLKVLTILKVNPDTEYPIKK